MKMKSEGLTAPGVVLLQSLLILLFETLEFIFTKVGPVTGVAIWVSFFGGIFLGRKGTTFTAVVTPPLALFLSTVFIICTVGGARFHIARIGLDLITSLSSLSVFLISGALISWSYYFISNRRK